MSSVWHNLQKLRHSEHDAQKIVWVIRFSFIKKIKNWISYVRSKEFIRYHKKKQSNDARSPPSLSPSPKINNYLKIWIPKKEGVYFYKIWTDLYGWNSHLSYCSRHIQMCYKIFLQGSIRGPQSIVCNLSRLNKFCNCRCILELTFFSLQNK